MNLNWQQRTWKAVQTVLYAVRPLVLYLLVPGMLHIVGSFFIPSMAGDPQYQRSTGNFYNFFGTLATGYLLYRFSRKRGSTIFQDTTLLLQKPDWHAVWLCAGFGASLALLFSAVISVLPLPGIVMNSYEADSKRVFLELDFILALFNLIVICPVMEELVIRGYLLNRLLGYFDQKHAVYVSAAIFAVCHMNPFWILYAFFLGIYMAKLALKKDNILYSLCFHIGFNFPAAINACILKAGLGESVVFKSKVLITLYGAVAAAAAVLIWRQMTKEEEAL